MELPYKSMQLEDLPNEVWVDVYGYDGIYEVSNLGRIRSVSREVNTRWGTGRWVDGKLLKQTYLKKDRTLMVSLQSRSRQMGRVVYDSFYTAIMLDEDECIMHKNKLLIDNRLVNLEKVTRKKSKKTDMAKSKRTITATPKNLEKAIETNKSFYHSRTHKQCNVCEKTLLLDLFIVEHNECKKCYNIRMRKKRETFIEKRIEKKCSKCLETKKIELFPKHNKVYCKKCSNEYALKRREKISFNNNNVL